MLSVQVGYSVGRAGEQAMVSLKDTIEARRTVTRTK